MIVVAIIGILAAIAIPEYQDYIARSQASEGVSLAGGLKTEVADSMQEGVCGSSSLGGKYAQSVVVSGTVDSTSTSGDVATGCEILVTYKDANVSKQIESTALNLSVQGNGSLKVIKDATTTLNDKYIPKGVK